MSYEDFLVLLKPLAPPDDLPADLDPVSTTPPRSVSPFSMDPAQQFIDTKLIFSMISEENEEPAEPSVFAFEPPDTLFEPLIEPESPESSETEGGDLDHEPFLGEFDTQPSTPGSVGPDFEESDSQYESEESEEEEDGPRYGRIPRESTLPITPDNEVIAALQRMIDGFKKWERRRDNLRKFKAGLPKRTPLQRRRSFTDVKSSVHKPNFKIRPYTAGCTREATPQIELPQSTELQASPPASPNPPSPISEVQAEPEEDEYVSFYIDTQDMTDYYTHSKADFEKLVERETGRHD